MPRPKFKAGNPGKPKGAVTKTTKLIKEVFLEAFNELQEDPRVKLTVWGKQNPTEFYKLASKLIPTQMNIGVNSISLMQLDPLNDITADDSTQEDSGA